MEVFELELKVFLRRDIKRKYASEKLANFISSYMATKNDFLEFHNSKQYKGYIFDTLKPLERDIYRAENNYTFSIRTVDVSFINFLLEGIEDYSNEDFKSLIYRVKKIKKAHLNKLYSLNPVIIKDDGYWKSNKKSIDFFEKRICENAFKKYKKFYNKELAESKFYSNIVFTNEKPVGFSYKNVTLLGDKVELEIKDDPISQEIAYMLIGTGIGENNSQGCGFVGYKYL